MRKSIAIFGTAMLLVLTVCGCTKPAEKAKDTEAASAPAVQQEEALHPGVIAGRQQTTKTDGCKTLTEIVDKALADGQGYANEAIGDDPGVLLVSEHTFGADEHPAAEAAELFSYKDGQIVYLGYVKTGGTATPLAIKDGLLYSSGHHYAGKHTVRNGSLLTLEEAWETFDKAGNVSYHYSSENAADSMESEKAKPEFDRLMQEYYEAASIVFDPVKR